MPSLRPKNVEKKSRAPKREAPSDARLQRLGELLARVVPVPDEWKKKPEPPKQDKGRNSLIYLISSSAPALDEAAYHGFAGEFVRAVAPYTEATDAGVLAHLLTAFGVIVGPGPHIWGGNEQPARINTVLVGPTSTGRKGTSFVPVDLLMKKVDPAFWEERYQRGLSSGEGLIQQVSDRKSKDEDGNEQIEEVDKRLYVLEPEFSKVLKQTLREGNILSQVLRETYDSGKLGVMTRNPLAANNAHISLTGHITPVELNNRLRDEEMANGFANRFLWFYVNSDKILPNARVIPNKVISTFAARLKRLIGAAAVRRSVTRDEVADSLWEEAYRELRQDRPGLEGAMLARGETIVLRLSLIYALLDGADKIRREHLEAALAVWKYNEESVRLIFKHKSGSRLADKLYKLLEHGPMTTKEFYNHGNEKAAEIREALELLERTGKIGREREPSGKPGRPAVRWYRIEG